MDEPQDNNRTTLGLALSDAETAQLREEMAQNATDASAFLKALSHPDRLMILCHLIDGEKTVTELEGLIGTRQSSVSQHLAKLRGETLVTPRRDGKAIHYSLTDPKTRELIGVLYRLFCQPKG